MSGNDRIVVVLTRYWPTALSIVRSLGAAGYIVDLIASSHKEGASDIAGVSKYVRNYTETVTKSVKRMDDPELMERLLSYRDSGGCKPVLFPTDDYTTSYMDRNRDLLSPVFEMPSADGGRRGALVEFMNKERQGELAREAGLLYPEGCTVSLEGEIEIPDTVTYPCFCKPLESYSGVKSEIAKCENREQLLRHLALLQSRNPYREILVQQFLDIRQEISICGVCIRDQLIIPAAIRKIRRAVHERGIAVTGELVPADVIDPVIGRVTEMMRGMDYVGMFDMDFQFVGDDIYFGEVNLRSGGTNYAYYLGGVNLPLLAVRGILGEEILPEETVIKEYGRIFAYEKVLWKECTEGHMSEEEARAVLDSAADRLIENDDDPRPAELFYANVHEELDKLRDKQRRRKINRITGPFRRRAGMLVRRYPQIYPFNSRSRRTSETVMVVGRNYCTNLCIARSLGMAGYNVEILRINTKNEDKEDLLDKPIPEAYSKYVKAFYSVRMKKQGRRVADALIRRADKEHRMLLIPTEDVAAYIADEYRDELSRYYITPDANGRQGDIIKLMSKDHQKEIAQRAGVPVLQSSLIRIRRGEFEIPDDIVYPCFIKPDVSRRARGSKKIMQKCADREELQAALTDIGRQLVDVDMTAEQYAEIRREMSLLGVCYEGIIVSGGLFEAVTTGHGSRTGVTVTGRSIPLSEISSISQALTEFLALTGYNGLFDIDLIESIDGGLYFVELNLRYGASGYVLTEAGVNLPGLLADHVLHGAELRADNTDKTAGISFVSEKVLLEELEDGCITPEEYHRTEGSVDIHFIKNGNDPKPYRHFRKFVRQLT